MVEKKRIIVDGIDVTECGNRFACHLDDGLVYCKSNPFCYFKQLARKTQECEDLKLILQQSKDNNKSTMLLLTKKNEECEQLKKLADANPNSTLRLRNEIRDLQAVSVKCKEALEEIERHFEHRCDICRNNYGIGADCSVCWHKDIRNIIKKAKGNN